MAREQQHTASVNERCLMVCSAPFFGFKFSQKRKNILSRTSKERHREARWKRTILCARVCTNTSMNAAKCKCRCRGFFRVRHVAKVQAFLEVLDQPFYKKK